MVRVVLAGSSYRFRFFVSCGRLTDGMKRKYIRFAWMIVSTIVILGMILTTGLAVFSR